MACSKSCSKRVKCACNGYLCTPTHIGYCRFDDPVVPPIPGSTDTSNEETEYISGETDANSEENEISADMKNEPSMYDVNHYPVIQEAAKYNSEQESEAKTKVGWDGSVKHLLD